MKRLPLFLALLLLAWHLLPMTTTTAAAATSDYNRLILETIATMPKGGGYATNAPAARNLRQAISVSENGQLRVAPRGATPSYCSGATYLLLLRVVETLQARKHLALPHDAAQALLVRGQADGTGIWGRWNANGPGAARLFAELGLGKNFTRYEEARPGDFMKIFWTPEVGSHERGHLVVYLGRRTVGGTEMVRFWSSNQPDGYGEKEVPRSKIANALFSRLEHPERLARAATLPKSDPYLASLLKVRSSFAQACELSGVPARQP